jgi:hypothetical protein
MKCEAGVGMRGNLILDDLPECLRETLKHIKETES